MMTKKLDDVKVEGLKTQSNYKLSNNKQVDY
jgi:hypothetical protein